MKWTTVIYILLFTVLFWGFEHARRDLWEPDEARYAFVAKEMMRDGHWAVPHRHGEYYAHKPPLYFWLIRLAVNLTGREVDGITARLPSLAASFATLVLTGLFASKLFGRKVVLPAVLVLSTCFLYWHEGGMGRMDSVLLAVELAALYLLLAGDERQNDGVRAAGYICLGIGVLTKGPVGFIVPLAAYLAVRRCSDGRKSLRHLWWGIPMALVIPLAWLAAAWAEGAPAAYFRELLFKQNVGRLAGVESFGKPNPFYFYFIHIPLEFMPWTLLLPISVAALIKGGRKKELIKLVAWAAAVVIFFSLSKGKRNLYILLAYPAMSLMIAGAADLFAHVSQRWRKNTMAVCASFMAVIGLVELNLAAILRYYSSITGEPVELPFPPVLLMYPAAAAVAGLAVVLYFYRTKGFGRETVIAIGAAFVMHWALVSNVIYPAMNEAKTPASIVDAVRPFAEAGETMVIYGETSEIVPLYCGMRSVSAVDPDELDQKMDELKVGVLVFREKSWTKIHYRIWKHVTKLGECTIGHKTMVIARFDMRE